MGLPYVCSFSMDISQVQDVLKLTEQDTLGQSYLKEMGIVGFEYDQKKIGKAVYREHVCKLLNELRTDYIPRTHCKTDLSEFIKNDLKILHKVASFTRDYIHGI